MTLMTATSVCWLLILVSKRLSFLLLVDSVHPRILRETHTHVTNQNDVFQKNSFKKHTTDVAIDPDEEVLYRHEFKRKLQDHWRTEPSQILRIRQTSFYLHGFD